MSKEGERASVLKTTKVRTKLKGDGSWMQRLGEPQSETEEEKPWIAEVRVNRLNGAPIDTSPVASPTSKTTPSTTRPAEDGGIFTKTDTKPAATSSTFNSLSVSTSSFTKRPSESYKRIAPHTVRPTSNLPVQTEDQLSPEEKEKREEAAMDVLRTSSARQRSYVLSAAKKYDSTEKPLETSLTPDVSSFVAKRVVITDNDDSVFTETPSVPKEPAAPSVKDVSPVSVKDVSPVSLKDVSPVSLKDVSPVSLKDVSPVSVKDVSPVSVKAVSPVSAKDVSPVSAKAVSPVSLKDVSPVSVKDVSSVSVKAVSPVSVKDVSPVSVKAVSPVPVKAVSPVSVKDISPVSVKTVSPVSVKTVSPVSVKAVSPVPVKDVSPVSVKDVSPVSVKAVSPVSVKDISPVSVKDVSPVSVKAVSPVSVKVVSPVSVKDISPVSVKTVSPVSVKDVLLPAPVIVDTPAVIGPYEGMKPGCTKMATPLPELKVEVMKKLSPESGVPLKDVPPVPSVLVSPVPYNPVKKNPATVDTLTALSDTLISFDTGSSRVHGEPIPQLMTDDLLSLNNGLEQELVKPIPPIPGSWSQELLYGSDRLSYAESEEEEEEPRDEKPEDTHRDIDSPTPSTDSSVNENVLEDLEDDDFIPINTNTTRHTWKRSWDVNPITTTDKSEEEEPEEQDPQVSLVTVQKQSSDSESPWDRWSAPTVCKEKRDPEPSMDRSSSYSRTLDSSANQRPTSPDTESKKGFVYLKEYVNATDLTKHNTRDNVPDYVTSSSTSHSYSSPSYTRTTTTSACTYCGEQVGNDAKITIEHLNISCHPACFKCGVCSKPMGDFLYNMFLHKGTVHCESCYSNVL
ncbi:zinc finger protein 185 isoform X2 [Oncorhynchus nerka]|uniref:zinc finger protein 185 isoform X2 n=1 Tax=Oncorhynchus nerka TaxID=8023 RepID=UPI0031B886B6